MNGRRAALLSAIGLSLIACVPTAIAANAHASSHRASGVVAATRFLPTLVRPGYHDAAGKNPYAGHLALVVDQTSRLLFTLDANPDGGLSPTYVGAYRLTDLKPAATRGTMLSGWVSTHLADPHLAGMMVAVSAGGVGATTTAIERVVAFHGVPKTTKVTPVSLGSGQVVVGLAAGPRPDLVFALSVVFQTTISESGTGQVPGTVQLSLVRLGHPGAIWIDRLQDCTLPVFGPVRQLPAPIGYVRSRRALDIGCVPPTKPVVGGFGSRPPLPGGVGVVNVGANLRRAPSDFTLEPVPGDTSSQPAGVWVPGLDRLAMQVITGGGGTWYVFDGRHDAWVGSVKLGPSPPQGAGVDPMHNRLYVVGGSSGSAYGGGLVVADLAPTPVDIGHAFPEFDVDPGPPGRPPLQAPVAVDPRTGQVFIAYADSPTFLVAHDGVARYTPPPLANPDANTTNVAERAGVTAATYSGSAQGYGSIVRQVGGASNVAFNVTTSQPPLGPTRELDASYLNNLSLGQSGTTAGAIAAQPDGATGQQVPRQPVGGGTMGGWPYQSVACHSGDASHAGWTADGAQVVCNDTAATAAIAAGSSSASYAAGASGTSAGTLVSVAGSTLSATTALTSKQGSMTSVTSIARGISLLGGLLRIGEVSTTAVASAHGRPHTAGSKFSRTLKDVTLDGTNLCNSDCSPATVAERVNTALAGHVLISFPTPDRGLAKGSPGGYQALVQRNPYSTVDERTLDDQPPNRLEVPGMEATIFEDNGEPSRTVIYLAGVEAEAHYGIYRLGQAGPGSTGPASAPAGTAPGAPGAPVGQTVTSPTADVAGAPTVAAPTGIAGALHHGWQLLTAGVGDVMRLLGVWLVLLAPVYLSARRWLLSRRHEVTHV